MYFCRCYNSNVWISSKGQNDIQKDDIHEDKPDPNGNVPIHDIKYYFANTKHPIVFINTSNHAMAEFDTNKRLWKWEYEHGRRTVQ